ncbi:CPBP family intramembrane metalloprotease [Candidatus Nomurabacteria bacterium]|nr:CPBP family intramembrane metalloprotease [Candidatus Nomurabacteria bacterium]
MERYFSRRNTIEIILGIILSITVVEVIMMQPSLSELSSGFQLLIATALQALLWFLSLRLSLEEKFSWKSIGMKAISWRWVAVASGIALLWLLRIFILGPLATLPFFQNGIDALQSIMTFSQIHEYILFGICAIIIAPVIEEIIFRGFFYRIMRAHMPIGSAILGSAMIFGMMHIIPLYALNGFLVGIPLAWLFEKTQSLIPGILMHALNNTIMFILMIILTGIR